MKIIRNQNHIEQRRKWGITASFVGMGILLGGFVLSVIGDASSSLVIVSFIALPLGFVVSQVGLYMANRYVRSPRIDEQLDEGVARVGKDSRLYHYVLPVSHVILSPAGIVPIVPKYQSGDIMADGYKWKQKGVNIFRRFFGQENLGNPSVEAEYQVKQVAKWISRHVPELAEQELPIGAIIVFTTKDGGNLDLKKSTVPAMHYTKMRGFWKQRDKDEPLDDKTYRLLREAFDKAAVEQGALDEDELETAD